VNSIDPAMRLCYYLVNLLVASMRFDRRALKRSLLRGSNIVPKLYEY
jgi:hypothetical protein